MPRQARLDAPGILQHVIIRGIERGRIVDDDKDRNDFIARIGELASETETKIYAWVLMDNHIHILLRSGASGLPRLMRRLLTGYAITYNRRHSRRGYLFQDRYKSMVCDEDTYFRELVRYIHLNPLRAKVVKNILELDRYPWCGHSVLMGYIQYPWHDSEYVWSWFGRRRGFAIRAYRQYVEEGAFQGRRPELVKGTSVESFRKEAEVLAPRGPHEKMLTDPRILGDKDFTEKILKESTGYEGKFQLPLIQVQKRMQSIIEERCKEEGVRIDELRMGSRRDRISKVRSRIGWQLVNDLGIPLVEVARQLGVSASGISKILQRKSGAENHNK